MTIRLRWILAFELGLGALGIALARWRDPAWPYERFVAPEAWWGIFSVPLLGLAWVATSRLGQRLRPLRRIFDDLRASPLEPVIRRGSALALGAIAVSAGAGEELLFREGIQPWLGLWATSLLFGALHALSPAYFLLALGMGLYCGWIYSVTGSWILVAALHAGYDWIALLRYRTLFREARQATVSASPDDTSP